MKNGIIIFMFCVLTAFSFSHGSDKPWIGTYQLEITDQNREMAAMFKDMDMYWPEISLHADSTFILLKSEGNTKITGTYTIQKTTLMIIALKVGGQPPEGIFAKPYSVEFKNDFQVLMFEGPEKEKWVKKSKDKTDKSSK